MGLTGRLKQISLLECQNCKKEFGKHSKKSFTRCLYFVNLDLYRAIEEIKALKNELFTISNVPKEIIVNSDGNVSVKNE